LASLRADDRLSLAAVAAVFPFKVNNHVVDQLIDWERVPDDPIFRLTFPQPEMLEPSALEEMKGLLRRNAPPAQVRASADRIRAKMNPHPGGQRELNVPTMDGAPILGAQHKYRETVLFFPEQGQTCHTYCTYCFRWAQFVGNSALRFASPGTEVLCRYLTDHPEVTDVLLTGGDPLVMSARRLRAVIEPLLDVESVRTVRIGTKALAWWPHRFTTDRDADELLELFAEVVARGRHLALMAHSSHPRELRPPVVAEAIRRINNTGAVVRCQSPLIRRVNDDPALWVEMWQSQVRLGAVPYYMFVERDTGPRHYFEVPLVRSLEIFQSAYREVSGLGRTVRGPSMSAKPGKVLLDGVTDVAGEAAFALKFIQARDPSWVGRIFFAKLDPNACWLDDLRPLHGNRFFFEDEAESPVYSAVAV
jgi:KamA family protein